MNQMPWTDIDRYLTDHMLPSDPVLDANPVHAEVARTNLARAGVTDRADVRVERVQKLLPRLVAADAGSFDVVFIDLNKANTPGYFLSALAHTYRGSLIIVDNVIRHGAIIEAGSESQ